MSEYAGRIAVGAVVALAVVVGLGFELSNFGSSVSASSTSASTSTGSTVSTTFTCTGGSYRNSTWMLTYNLTDGRISTIVSPCNALDSQKGMGLIDVTTNPVLPILLANGWSNAFYVNLTSRQITQIPGVTFSPNYIQAFYNGQQIINGTSLPNPYSTATPSNRSLCTFVNGDGHVSWTPLQSGPIYVKVITDQGVIVNNGTVFMTHSANYSNPHINNGEVHLISADYCLSLSSVSNTTGFIQVADPGAVTDGGDGLNLTGYYNFTVSAAYGANRPLQIVVPQLFDATSNATIYITISVPSGEVTIVTIACSQANACTQSTTTSSAKGG